MLLLSCHEDKTILLLLKKFSIMVGALLIIAYGYCLLKNSNTHSRAETGICLNGRLTFDSTTNISYAQ